MFDPKTTILVADDNRANREALASLLEAVGYDVIKAANGAEALERAREQRPRLIISDVLMPLMDGYELARRLREDASTRGTALLFYTAYFSERSAQELARAHGVAKVLVKPSDNDVILDAVREALASRPDDSRAGTEPGQDLDQDHLRVMVDQLLQKTGALEAQQRRIERLNRTLSTLSAVNALIVRAQDRQALLEDACRIAVDTGGFGYAAIALFDRASGQVHPVAAAGEGSDDPEVPRFPVEPRFALVNDLDAVKDVPGRDSALKRGLRSCVVLPLVVGGTPAGALLLYARTAGFFDDDEMKLLNELAGDISFALNHLAQKARMDYLAYHDPLTGLPNRALFGDRLTQALSAARREKRLAAVIYVDLQRFRLVNETFGRKAGDDLLRQVGTRLRRAVRDQDTVGRMSADHFAIAIAGFDRIEELTGLLGQAMDAAASPITVEGAELRISLRAGVAVFPADGESAETLNGNAEAAMNRARDTGQGTLFYAPHMNERVAESLALENRLRHAIEFGELSLHYQPKFDMRTSKVAGLEALIRWNDKELGQVPPSRFVALMEETGMILAAGRWALEKALEDMRHWRSRGLSVPRTSVNVSALQLKQTDFVDSVLDAMRAYGGSPLLDLEITESVLVEDIEECTRKLQILRGAGVQVSVDDFGTGYSSLNYLARLPVDTLKIDRSFVISLRDTGYPRNIVAMIVSLAHTLGLKVIAEGVEEDGQRELLRELGCDQIQGFLTGRPMTADKIEPLLEGYILG
ncbi:MAG TPA: EAL domain-containing protein [Burkholderiales bacterium]|nr:EAL domain-containing protein [Burkholderiales bacterium]